MSVNPSAAPSTISDIEQTLQIGLEALRNAPLNEQIASALKFLVPPGYKPIAQLEEDGRKKRSTAAASNWTPETGEIVIYFEPLDKLTDAPAGPPANLTPFRRQTETVPSQSFALSPAPAPLLSAGAETDPSEIPSLQIQQCCEALAEAEKAGKLFIAFKWFRDEALPAHNFDWSASLDMRQRVLAKAVEMGAIQTKPIRNPRSPEHPTTTISLNRTEASRFIPSRFHPIPVQGEPVSATILRDRGSI
jgi:hypothetical protein